MQNLSSSAGIQMYSLFLEFPGTASPTWLRGSLLRCSPAEVYSIYVVFFRTLLGSSSLEVQFLAHLVMKDSRSTSCKSSKLLEMKTYLGNPCDFSSAKLKASLPIQNIPENEIWRLGLLKNLFILIDLKLSRMESTQDICAMIDSLLNT